MMQPLFDSETLCSFLNAQQTHTLTDENEWRRTEWEQQAET